MTDWQYEYNRLVNSAMQLNRMYKSKSKRIERAIEHIKETINRWEDYEQFYEVVVEDKYILEILKGEDKE